jgi:hypothetical protein
MSASVSATKKVVLSEKFNKEVEKFFEWAGDNSYVVKFKDSDEKDWTMNLVKSFDEPARNKLESLINKIMENHTIYCGEDEIADAKLFAKDFKEGSKGKKSEKVEKPKKSEKVEKPKKSEVEVESFKVLDIEDETWYMCDLELTTKELENVFGKKAKKTGKKNDSHRYEWKFKWNGNVYSVYDWAYTDGSFDDYEVTSWHLGSDSDDNKTLKEVISKMTEWKAAKEDMTEKKVEKKKVEKKKVEKKKVEKKIEKTVEDENREAFEEALIERQLAMENNEIDYGQDLDNKKEMEDLFGDEDEIEVNIDNIDWCDEI